MKLNVTVDLQDIFDNQNEQAYYDGESGESGGGYDLNDSIREEIIGAILSRVSEASVSAVMEKANEKVEQALDEAISKSIAAIEQKSVDYATNWLENKNVKITDRWGAVKEETSIQEIINKSFTDTLQKTVDKNGNFSNSYDAKTKLIDYVTTKHIENCVTSRLPDMDYRLNKVINEVLEKQATDLLASKLNKVIS